MNCKILLVAVCFSVALYGQLIELHAGATARKSAEFAENAKSLTAVLSLPHKVYLPGEDICVDVRIENTSGQTVEVFDPFAPKYEWLDVLKKEGATWRSAAYQEAHDSFDLQREKRWVPTGEILERRVCTSDEREVAPIGFFPQLDPGEYAIVFPGWLAKPVYFTVVPVSLESVVETELPGQALAVVAAILSEPNGHKVLVVKCDPGARHGDFRLAADGKTTRETLLPLFLFRRVSESSTAISEVRVEIDTAHHVAIRWINEGRAGLARFDERMNPLPE